jgi:hypothetical protein
MLLGLTVAMGSLLQQLLLLLQLSYAAVSRYHRGWVQLLNDHILLVDTRVVDGVGHGGSELPWLEKAAGFGWR